MNGNYYIIFDGKSVIGVDKGKFEDYVVFQNYSEFDGNNAVSNLFDARFLLTGEQVIDLLEYDRDLNGKNVYGFTIADDNHSENLTNMLKSDASKAMSEFINIGDYSNTELIEKLRDEEENLHMTEDAVKRPSHYMLEDGTEVKNHIRSILGDEGFKSWAIGNAIKYVSRYKDKGKPTQDLKKAKENIQMVIDVLGEQDDLDQ